MRINFDSSEIKGLAAKLTRKQTVVGAELTLSLRRAADNLEDDAKLFAPVDTGALRNSIHATLTGRHTAVIGSDLDYAAYVERGTSDTAPQPFMRPAAARRIPQLERAIRDIGGDIL